ncbi:MAG: TrlF family AAA-like ATPase [Cyclobacteriaceae bacterium]
MIAGSKFVRADLHIHSFGEFGSYDVIDHTMTPEAIVDTCLEKGLKIISVTDHNEIQNSNAAINYAKGKDILVIPGIEVTTTQGHLLVYFETFKDLRDFFGKLTVTPDKTLTSQGIVQCLDLAAQHSGIGILAHIELTSGFEKTIARFGPQMEEILKHKNLFGLEISSKTSADFYTDLDEDTNRKSLCQLRRDTLGLDNAYVLPKIMSSDSHSLSRLGTNAEGEKKLTRIKVDSLDFHSFKIALITHESRIRLEDHIPEKRPILKTITIEGGILDKVTVELSTNLTCVIGGRGAGKSTFIESLREASGNKSGSKLVDSDVWPQKIKVTYEDESGQILEFAREKNSKTRNNTDPINGITKVDIENYGQGETAETLQHSGENPMVLVELLDSFLDLEKLKLDDKEYVTKLRENQSESRRLRLELLSLDETKKALLNEQTKLSNLQKEKAGDLVRYQNALIKERQLRSSLVTDLNNLIKTYQEILKDKDIFNNLQKLPDSEIIVGKDFFNKVKEIVSDFSKIVQSKASELNDALNKKVEELKVQITGWAEKEKSIQEKIDKKKEELEAMGIPFDLGKINQISKDIIDLESRVKKLEGSQKRLKDLETERKQLVKQRQDVKNKIFYQRYGHAEVINKNLTNTLDGLLISVKYEQGKYSDSFEKLLKSTMDYRTSQVPKALLVTKQISPLDFVDICRKNGIAKLQALTDEQGQPLLLQAECKAIILKINNDHCFEDFEVLDFEDRPSITVTKIWKDDKGITQRNSKPLSQLSLGQQQSVMLAILMLSKSNKPLIIDQPEDNLDSEFIFKTIVKNLRKIKEARQVIIVTHNANIAVLGDAELIVPLKSTNIKSHVLSPGSIDRKETREICCEILEGGRSAFIQRQQIYGI